MNTTEQQKRAAAHAGAECIRDGMAIGIGTGSTVRYVLEHIAARRAGGDWQNLRAVSTSDDTTRRAADLGIPLCTLAEAPELDLAIDGADEVDPNLDLIKGLGGALLREKIVAAASRRLVIVADEGKLVARLGSRSPVPVEVDPFAAPVLPAALRRLGGEAALRHAPDGAPVRTDGGHWIFDCWFQGGLDDPAGLEREINMIAGVLENGLFVHRAAAVIVAGREGVRTLLRGTQ